GNNVIAVAKFDHFTADESAQAHPVGEAQREDDNNQIGAENAPVGFGGLAQRCVLLQRVSDGNHQQQPGNGADDREEPGDGIINPTPKITGNDPKQRPDGQADGAGDH